MIRDNDYKKLRHNIAVYLSRHIEKLMPEVKDRPWLFWKIVDEQTEIARVWELNKPQKYDPEENLKMILAIQNSGLIK